MFSPKAAVVMGLVLASKLWVVNPHRTTIVFILVFSDLLFTRHHPVASYTLVVLNPPDAAATALVECFMLW